MGRLVRARRRAVMHRALAQFLCVGTHCSQVSAQQVSPALCISITISPLRRGLEQLLRRVVRLAILQQNAVEGLPGIGQVPHRAGKAEAQGRRATCAITPLSTPTKAVRLSTMPRGPPAHRKGLRQTWFRPAPIVVGGGVRQFAAALPP